jgi:hypothetical protein
MEDLSINIRFLKINSYATENSLSGLSVLQVVVILILIAINSAHLQADNRQWMLQDFYDLESFFERKTNGVRSKK